MIWLFFGLAAAALFGLNAVIIRHLELSNVSPTLIAVSRLYIGALFIFFFLKLSGRKVSFKVENKLLFALVAIFGVAANFVAYNFAIQLTDASTAVLLESTAPIFVIVLGIVLFKQGATLREAAAVVLSFVGVFIIFFNQNASLFSLTQPKLVGSLLGLVAGLTWGLFTISSKHSLKKEGALELLFKVFVVAGICLTPLALADLRFSWTAVPWLFAQGAVTTALAYYMYYAATKKLSAVTTSILFCFSPVAAIVASKVLLNEVPSFEVLSGGVLILGGVLLSRTETTNE